MINVISERNMKRRVTVQVKKNVKDSGTQDHGLNAQNHVAEV